MGDDNNNTVKRVWTALSSKLMGPLIIVLYSAVLVWAANQESRINDNTAEMNRHNVEREAMKTELKYIQRQLERIESKLDNR